MIWYDLISTAHVMTVCGSSDSVQGRSNYVSVTVWCTLNGTCMYTAFSMAFPSHFSLRVYCVFGSARTMDTTRPWKMFSALSSVWSLHWLWLCVMCVWEISIHCTYNVHAAVICACVLGFDFMTVEISGRPRTARMASSTINAPPTNVNCSREISAFYRFYVHLYESQITVYITYE